MFKLPAISFGTFQIAPNQTRAAVTAALQSGYRAVDTAYSYKNEAAVGQAIRQAGLTRDRVFVTSKAYINQLGFRETSAAIDQSLAALGLDYLDLYLIHMPFGDYYGAYRALLAAKKARKVRAIGVANFDPARLADLGHHFGELPAVDQVEHHPFYQRSAEIAAIRKLGVTPQAWAPLAEGRHQLFTNSQLTAIAQAHGKTVAQVVLKWHQQLGLPLVVKSLSPNHLKDNLALDDFRLTALEMATIAKLDLGRPSLLDINSVAEVDRLYDYLDHPVVTTLAD